MKFFILCQEEPVFLGPVLQGVLRERPGSVAGVLVAGRRSAGERHRTWRDRIESVRTFWAIFEPAGFCEVLYVRIRSRLLGSWDPRSVAGTAKHLGLPVHRVADPRSPEFLALLRELRPDVVLNQSEVLLSKDVLAVPTIGFINRHGSLLPHFRGRMGAFWSHASGGSQGGSQGGSRYGVTIHFVDEGIDTGGIIVREELPDVDPSWPYPRVMAHLCAAAPTLLWRAIDLLSTPGFVPIPNTLPSGQPVPKARVFPTLAEAREYRMRIAERRRSGERGGGRSDEARSRVRNGFAPPPR